MVWEQFAGMGAIGLYLFTALSATLLPVGSEPVVVVAVGILGAPITFVITLLGWMTGGVINWYIGIKGLHKVVERDRKTEKKAQAWFDRWGPLSLVITPWIPFVGDPVTLMAGTLEMPLPRFLFWAGLGKVIKLTVLILAGQTLLALWNVWGLV